jgi:hypothetical protein
LPFITGFFSCVLVIGSAALAYGLAAGALIGSAEADWSADPVVWWWELILAAFSALLGVATAVLIVRRFRAGSAGSARTMLWIGLGFLAVGALSIAAGWLGLRVPTTYGIDPLQRGEFVLVIFGVIVGVFGALVTFLALVAEELRDLRA